MKADGMEQGHQSQRAIVGAVAQPALDRYEQHARVGRPMGNHHALGQPGRAGGIHHEGKLVGARCQPGREPVRRAATRGKVCCIADRAAKGKNRRTRWQRSLRGGDDCFVRRADQTGNLSFPDQRRRLIRLQARIYHAHHCPQPVQGEDRNRVFKNIRQHRGDAVTIGDTGTFKSRGHDLGFADQFCE